MDFEKCERSSRKGLWGLYCNTKTMNL